MFIEATEAIVCPACGPPQSLIAVVDRLDGRRILEGYLGCPSCENRYPVRRGHLLLGDPGEHSSRRPDSDEAGSALDSDEAASAPDSDEAASERVLQLAALLGLQESAGGYLLLDEGLEGLGEALARQAEATEWIVLVPPGGPGPGDSVDPTDSAPSADPADSSPRVTRLYGAALDRLPVQSGCLRGVALGRGSPARLAEAARALAIGGRLVVLEPTRRVREEAARGPLDVLVSEERALVAVRRVPPAPVSMAT